MIQEIKLSNYLSRNGNYPRILTGVVAENREELLEKMAELFIPNGDTNKYTLEKRLIENESIRKTAENGYAIPHARTSLVEETQAAIITTTGTNYPSLDNQIVYFAIGIINTAEEIKIYLPLLGLCAGMIKKGKFTPLMDKIKQTKQIKDVEIYQIILDYEKNVYRG